MTNQPKGIIALTAFPLDIMKTFSLNTTISKQIEILKLENEELRIQLGKKSMDEGIQAQCNIKQQRMKNINT